MRRRSRLSEVAFFVCASGAAATAAGAAVRVCGDAITASASASSERAAKKSALDQWKVGAAEIGAGYTSWRLAAEKILSCHRVGREIVCNLRGRPCVLRQAPPAESGMY